MTTKHECDGCHEQQPTQLAYKLEINDLYATLDEVADQEFHDLKCLLIWVAERVANRNGWLIQITARDGEVVRSGDPSRSQSHRHRPAHGTTDD